MMSSQQYSNSVVMTGIAIENDLMLHISFTFGFLERGEQCCFIVACGEGDFKEQRLPISLESFVWYHRKK